MEKTALAIGKTTVTSAIGKTTFAIGKATSAIGRTTSATGKATPLLGETPSVPGQEKLPRDRRGGCWTRASPWGCSPARTCACAGASGCGAQTCTGQPLCNPTVSEFAHSCASNSPKSGVQSGQKFPTRRPVSAGHCSGVQGTTGALAHPLRVLPGAALCSHRSDLWHKLPLGAKWP